MPSRFRRVVKIGTYLADTDTRRVRRALGALFNGAVGKDTVSRVCRRHEGRTKIAWQSRRSVGN